MKKNLPIGREDFKSIIEKNMYYVDKTNIIESLLKTDSYISLFPRPRRFGKSLFLSMVDNFFNIEYKETNKDLFKGLAIEKSEYYKELSSKPVIKLNFKRISGRNYDEMYQSYVSMIRDLFISKDYLKEKLNEAEIEIFDDFMFNRADLANYKAAIYILSSYLYKYYNEKVIILIDEYDVPIQEGYLKGYYEDIVSLIREVFSNALKGNEYVEFGIMTGVLRVSKESLFSDLNNVKVYGIVEDKYNECFGFTESETKELLEYYDLELSEEVKNMYDGYNFNGVSIYNPWSILNYADSGKLIPYWVNTSGNELLINMIKNTTDDVKVTIEKLLSGESVYFEYNEKITYLDYKNINSQNSILNLLFISGYITLSKNIIDEFGENKTTAKLPNREVKHLFINILNEIFTDDYQINNEYITKLCSGVLNNNKELMEEMLNKILPNMSYMDETESFYHGYMLGLFSRFMGNNFSIKSNRESGAGRFDLMIKKNDGTLGMIIELKIAKIEDMEKVAKEALGQIEEKEYYEILVSEQVKTIYKYVIIFKGKKCIVR